MRWYQLLTYLDNFSVTPCRKLSNFGLFLPPANEVCEGYVFTGVCHSVHGGGMRGCSGGGHAWLLWGGGMVALGGHAWLLQGGMCGCSGGGHAWLLPGGACMVALGGCAWLLPGGVHGCSGGRAWFF